MSTIHTATSVTDSSVGVLQLGYRHHNCHSLEINTVAVARNPSFTVVSFLGLVILLMFSATGIIIINNHPLCHWLCSSAHMNVGTKP